MSRGRDKTPLSPASRSPCAVIIPHSYPSKGLRQLRAPSFLPSSVFAYLQVLLFTPSHLLKSGRSSFSHSSPSLRRQILLRGLEDVLLRQVELEALS